MAIYSMAPFLGPVIGPIASGFINQVSLDSVRWVYYSDGGAAIVLYTHVALFLI